MNWMTREKVKVVRVARPWFTRTFIGPEAVFLFVPADPVMSKTVDSARNARKENHGRARL